MRGPVFLRVANAISGVAVVVILLDGVAAAAYARVLPASIQHLAHEVIGAPAPSATTVAAPHSAALEAREPAAAVVARPAATPTAAPARRVTVPPPVPSDVAHAVEVVRRPAVAPSRPKHAVAPPPASTRPHTYHHHDAASSEQDHEREDSGPSDDSDRSDDSASERSTGDDAAPKPTPPLQEADD